MALVDAKILINSEIRNIQTISLYSHKKLGN